MWWQVGLIVPLCLLLGGVATLALLSLFAPRPTNLGVRDGRLAPCPETPNCVSSQAPADDAVHRMEPIPFDGPPEVAMRRLKAALATLPRVHIVSETDRYLHAEFTSLVFRFIDDVEFAIDDGAKVIHFRSASRVGRSDLGANRRRMEAVQKAFGEVRQ
jgi:uncharacterized protein (DUF1499 family)